MSQKAFFTIEFKGGKETVLKIDEVRKQLKSVATDINNAKKAGEKGVYKQLILQQADLKKNLKDTNAVLRQQQGEFDRTKYPTDSLHGLELQYSKLRTEIRGMSADMRNSTDGRDLIKQADSVKSSILKIDGSMKDFKSNIGNYRSAFNGIGDMLTGGLLTGGFAAVGLGIAGITKYVFSLNVEIDKIQSNVRKTTNLTAEQVEALTDRLSDLDTATTLQDLLKISVEAGRFGVTGEEAVFKFTEAVNVLNIALGDEFQGGIEEATNRIAKLSNVLFGVTTDGAVMAENFQHIGNALNVLANNGAASAGEITDVASRIAGMGTAIGLTQGEILGVSSAIIEMGINVERGGSAFTKLNQKMREDVGKFAKAIGITKDQLKSLLDDNPLEALNMVINKLVARSGGSATELVSLMGDLGIRGVGISEIFFKWAQNQELVNDRTNQGNIAIKETNSLLAEQETMMDNIPGQWARFKNALSDFTVNSGIQTFFKDMLKAASDLLGALGNIKRGVKPPPSTPKGNEVTLDYPVSDNARKETEKKTKAEALTAQKKAAAAAAAAALEEEKAEKERKARAAKAAEQARKIARDLAKQKELTPDSGSIKQLEQDYSDLMALMQVRQDPKTLTTLIIKANAAKKKLDEATEALQVLINTEQNKGRVTPGLLTPLPSADSKDIGILKSEKGIKKEKEDILQMIDDVDKATTKSKDDKEKEDKEFEEKKKARRKQYADAAIDLAQVVSDGIFALNDQERRQEEDARLTAIDKDYEQKLKAAQGNASLEEAIKKETEAKKLAIQREYFEKDKKAKIAQAIINGALSVITAFTIGPIAGAIAAVAIAAATSFQVATIRNQKFRRGGFTGDGFGTPDETGKKVAGYVHEKEYVGSEEQVERYPRLFKWLESDRLKHLRGFALGGFTTPPQILSPRYASEGVSSSSFSGDQISDIATAVHRAVYEGALSGTAVGARQGSFEGTSDHLRLRERESNLKQHTEV